MQANVDPFNQWGDENQTESHELNERVPFNHNFNTSYMTSDVREPSVESLNIDTMQSKGSALNGEVRKSYFNEVPTEGSYVLLWKYCEQIKSILAGLLLVLCSGLHTVWAIYQVLFFKTSKEFRDDLSQINKTEWRERYFNDVMSSERVGLMFTIICWYVGMILGCFVAGWFLVRTVQKKNVYYVAALVMFASGCVFYSADVAVSGWQTILLFGRLIAGISHGITYVTIFVQASENATKDFRRTIVTIIGLTMGLSIFIASTFLIYIPMPDVQLTIDVLKGSKPENVAYKSETMSSGIISTATIALSFISVVINFFFSHETVPFLLYHNYREEEAQSAMARLMGEDQHAPVVQQEFEAMREMCHDDYAEFPEGKIFTTIHRRLVSIVLSARITSAQCFHMLFTVMFVKLIESMIISEVNQMMDKPTIIEFIRKWEDIMKLIRVYEKAVRWAIAIWFILGVPITLVGNYFNWKRGFHFATFLVGASMTLFTIFHWAGLFSGFFRVLAFLFLSIYIHFLTLPVDVINYLYLMECFPTSTKAMAIAFTTICECIFNIIFISVEIEHKNLGIEYFCLGLLWCLLGFRLCVLVPNTNGLSLAAAKHAYIQALSSNWWEFYKKK
ncbi:uncharacterized protein LOC129578299 [Sitodiplosis mosellana]|uniref:uncharacterized protein LOC129578299 n=1 Tax=Sitodiplosis mosellana TaxID=263140 RepID=UPI0024440C5C|nr:uncharacterized protein LOC129578299 [Sitodiplosis mosellana]